MAASSDDELTTHGRAVRAAIHAVVRRIPRGAVATYGQIAELAGFPGGARVAGAALKTSKPGDRLPWQRVVGKRGNLGVIAIHDPVGAAVQRGLLTDEGVAVSDRGTIPLVRYGWIPTAGRVATRRSRATPKRATRAKPTKRRAR